MLDSRPIDPARTQRTILLGLAALLCIFVGLYALAALSVPTLRQPLIVQLARTIPVPLMMHLAGSAVAIIIGTFQLSRGIRARRIALHRWLGRLYVIGVLIGGLGGLLLAVHSSAGLVAQTGFTMLAILWLYSTLAAYTHIRNRRIEQHRIWMIRSYALTFAAVTLRIWLPLSQVAGMPFTEAYPAIAWFCWVPNLIVVEWLILRRS
jgi:lysylphosphatidylglycerol synthetase-like protein (DUF2156 family)